MLKTEYFKYFYDHKLYQKRMGLNRVSFVIPEKDEPEKDYPAYLTKENKVGFINKEGEVEYIEDAVKDAPLFGLNEPLTLTNEHYRFVKEKTVTTYRHVIMHLLLITDIFGDGFGFIKEQLNKKILAKIIEDGAKDGSVTIEQHFKLTQRAFFISFLSKSCTPTGSATLWRSHREVTKVRDELTKKFKDQLNNPAVVGMINEAIIEELKKVVEKDASKGFFTKPKKTRDKALLNTHGMIGGVPSLTDNGEVITIVKSLTEGWGPDEFVALVNNLRGGSIDRGQDTALGGSSFKDVSRILQNSEITIDDCKDKVGYPIWISESNFEKYVGRYMVGKEKPLTEADVKKYIGKVITLRGPGTCKVGKGNFCKKCMGDLVSDVIKRGVSAAASEATGAFLSMFLASFHGKTIQTVLWDVEETLF